jgi:hypothetical protein
MKLYMFRTVRLSIIRSLLTVHSAMVYAIQLSSWTRMELQFHPGPELYVQQRFPENHAVYEIMSSVAGHR